MIMIFIVLLFKIKYYLGYYFITFQLQNHNMKSNKKFYCYKNHLNTVREQIPSLKSQCCE